MVRNRQEGSEAGPPTRFAEGPPPPQESGGLPLLAVMEIQRTLGSLTTSVAALQEAQKEANDKLDAVAQKIHTAQTVGWVIGVGIMAVIGFAGWIINQAIALLPSILAAKK